MTGYAAVVARELDIPMICHAGLPDVPDGTEVMLDAERGVLYSNETGDDRADDRPSRG